MRLSDHHIIISMYPKPSYLLHRASSEIRPVRSTPSLLARSTTHGRGMRLTLQMLIQDLGELRAFVGTDAVLVTKCLRLKITHRRSESKLGLMGRQGCGYRVHWRHVAMEFQALDRRDVVAQHLDGLLEDDRPSLICRCATVCEHSQYTHGKPPHLGFV